MTIIHAPSVLKCRTRAKAAQVLADMPKGTAKIEGTNVHLIEALEVKFSKPFKRPAPPLSDGPSIIHRPRRAPVTLTGYRPSFT